MITKEHLKKMKVPLWDVLKIGVVVLLFIWPATKIGLRAIAQDELEIMAAAESDSLITDQREKISSIDTRQQAMEERLEAIEKGQEKTVKREDFNEAVDRILDAVNKPAEAEPDSI